MPLPVPGAGNDSGTFQFPPEGTLVEIGFNGGRPDKPFVRQTMPEGNSLHDVKAGEQLQQQREEVSQRITQGGDWVRKTDQTISESSMSRQIEADDERRTLVARETTIKATDKTTVVGQVTLMAGAIQHVTLGDYALAIQGNRIASIAGDCKTSISGKSDTTIAGGSTSQIAGDLMEKIGVPAAAWRPRNNRLLRLSSGSVVSRLTLCS